MHGNRKRRRCRRFKNNKVYKPLATPACELEELRIYIDEFEAVRLCDYDGMDQTQAAEKMGVSRATVQRLLYAGRKKFVQAILESKILIIDNDTKK